MRDWDFIGTVDSWENGVAHCTQRGKFAVGDSIEILQPDGSVVKLTPAWIENADGERVDATPAPDDAVHHPLRDAADGVQPDSDAEAVIVLLPGTMRASAPTKQLQK